MRIIEEQSNIVDWALEGGGGVALIEFVAGKVHELI